MSRSLSTAVKGMRIQPPFGGDARYFLPKLEHQALPKNFLEEVLKPFGSPSCLCWFYAACWKESNSANTPSHQKIPTARLTTLPPECFLALTADWEQLLVAGTDGLQRGKKREKEMGTALESLKSTLPKPHH